MKKIFALHIFVILSITAFIGVYMNSSRTYSDGTFTFTYPRTAHVMRYSEYVEADVYNYMTEAVAVIMPEKHTNFKTAADPLLTEDYKPYVFIIAPDGDVNVQEETVGMKEYYYNRAKEKYPEAQVFYEGETEGYLHTLNDTDPFPPAYFATERGIYKVSFLGGNPYVDPERKYREQTQSNDLQRSLKAFQKYPEHMSQIISSFRVVTK